MGVKVAAWPERHFRRLPYQCRLSMALSGLLLFSATAGAMQMNGTEIRRAIDGALPQATGYSIDPGFSGGAVVDDVDFRRGELGEGRVTVTLSDADIAVDVTGDGGDIRVTFPDTMIPEALQRRLDVTSFDTPVMTVHSSAEEVGAVMVVELSDEVETDYLAYQTDERFILEVTPLAQDDDHAGDQAPGFSGEKLSLNFQDIALRSVLQLIADFTGLNLVASDTVTGRITLRLEKVPWDQALDIILKTRGLDKRLEGNVLMVMPAAELAAMDRQELESRRQLSELAPLRSEFFEVRYANAAEVVGLFEKIEKGEGVISSRGSALVDERTNSIIITDTETRINAFREVLGRLDVPVRQVLIEARIVTANTTFSRSIGVRWGALGAASHKEGELLSQWGGSLTTIEKIRETASPGQLTSSSGEDALIVDLGLGGSSSFAVGLVDDDFLLELEIDALETEGNGEVIARPKVITADRQQASIASGSQIPYQEASSSGATSTSFVDAVLGLTVTPRITPDDRIIMDLDISQDSIGEIFGGVPSINTNSIRTQVLVRDGETVVLGGVFNTTTAESVSRTPLLGDLPWIGGLFRSRVKTEAKNELLIFITPRLLRDFVSR